VRNCIAQFRSQSSGAGDQGSGRCSRLEYRRCAGALFSIICCALAGVTAVRGGNAVAGSDPYRGLWVGQVNLNFVNEVSVPFDADNVAVAPDPKVPTPTSDQAQIRLILHVNGAGQVNLLKEVAVLRRTDAGETNQLFSSEADYALVTDDRLYSDFPVQQARRIASAVFDFGDFKATEAVGAVVASVSASVAASVMGSVDAAGARSAAAAAAASIVPKADVAESFDAFLKESLSQSDVTELVYAGDPAAAIQALRPAAEVLVNQSFYHDTRAADVLDALEAAIESAATPAAKEAAAQNAVARYADVENQYERYVHGKLFGDMIREVALAGARQAANTGIARAAIDAAARLAPAYTQAAAEALKVKVAAYADTAAPDALESVVSNIVDAAFTASADPVVIVEQLAAELESLGFTVLSTLQQGAVSVNVPSADYTEFVRSATFAGAVATAAAAAAEAAVALTATDPFYTESALEGAARVAATTALTAVYARAGRARQNELPLAGLFGLGSGDARFVCTIKSTDAPLGGAGLTGTIKLPANHPTNPFRHRRHPDHTVGFDIERRLRLDFDGVSTNALSKTGLGVERMTGIYREEIFGLHKPLGPEPASNPVGLKVEGSFEINRITLIDTLNAR